MKWYKSLSFALLFLVTLANAQSANRFFYELTFKPQKDSARTEKHILFLDITKDRSIYRDHLQVTQDSILKTTIESSQKSGIMPDITKIIKLPKFGHTIRKVYPITEIRYTERMLQDDITYKEAINFNWKIESEKSKIGEYQAQKATTEFGGRKWTAWFSEDLPFQDGPYKFYGLPGLIVKIEDANQNYSWQLKGNKTIENWEEETYAEKLNKQFGQRINNLEVDRKKFETLYADYKNDPFAKIKGRIPAEALSQKMPGQDRTIGEVFKEQEKWLKDAMNANNNNIEIQALETKAKK